MEFVIPGSSNGRTPDSESGNRGSNPCPGASNRYEINEEMAEFGVSYDSSYETLARVYEPMKEKYADARAAAHAATEAK